MILQVAHHLQFQAQVIFIIEYSNIIVYADPNLHKLNVGARLIFHPFKISVLSGETFFWKCKVQKFIFRLPSNVGRWDCGGRADNQPSKYLGRLLS